MVPGIRRGKMPSSLGGEAIHNGLQGTFSAHPAMDYKLFGACMTDQALTCKTVKE
jgi:hypothetical protein